MFRLIYVVNIYGNKNRVVLNLVSTRFLLNCFLSLKGSTCEIRKNVFYFTSKALFVLEIIKVSNFKYSNFMTSWKCLKIKKKPILLNYLDSRHGLFMKCGQFISYYNTKNFIKKLCNLKTNSRPFSVCKKIENEIFKASYLYLMCKSKNI